MNSSPKYKLSCKCVMFDYVAAKDYLEYGKFEYSKYLVDTDEMLFEFFGTEEVLFLFLIKFPEYRLIS